MEKLKAVWKDVVESLWFLPSLMTISGGALALLIVRYNDAVTEILDPEDVWWIFGGGSDGAKSVLEAIAGSIMTVTGVVFSVTIIALQLASNQYSPRVLRQFMADRANQLVLGVFIGTFTYTLLVLRTVRSSNGNDEAFIPHVAVTGGVLLTLVSLGFLIFFINHLARSIQAHVIVDSVTGTSLQTLNRMYPDQLHEWSPRSDICLDDVLPATDTDAYLVRAGRSGYVQAVERRALLSFATQHDLLISVEIEIGAFILPGQVIMKAWPSTHVTADAEAELADQLVLGTERTPHQDMKHGLIEMMDMAVKSLSPAINDPTTAVNVIQRQAEVLLNLAWRECGPVVDRDAAGTSRLVLRRPGLKAVVDMAYDQIRHFGASNASVAIALIQTLGELAALAPDQARPAFADQLNATIASTRELMKDPGDVARVEEAIERALRRSQETAPRQRPHR